MFLTIAELTISLLLRATSIFRPIFLILRYLLPRHFAANPIRYSRFSHLVTGTLGYHLWILSTWFKTQTLSAPVLGKRSRATDDPKLTDLPWLEEVHSKIWNRKDLRPQLFRNVDVTQAHYAALQKRLKELHSDRDSPDYDGTKTSA
jgi:hypothetical protein